MRHHHESKVESQVKCPGVAKSKQLLVSNGLELI